MKECLRIKKERKVPQSNCCLRGRCTIKKLSRTKHIARPYPPGHSHTAILAEIGPKSRYGSQKAVLFRFKSALFLRPLQWVLRSFTGKLGVVRKLVLPRFSLLLCACRLLTQCAVRTQRAQMYALDISIPHRPGSDCSARLDGAFLAADHIVRTGRDVALCGYTTQA